MDVPVASAEELPVIDIGPLYSKDATKEQLYAIVQAIRGACINTGKSSRPSPSRWNSLCQCMCTEQHSLHTPARIHHHCQPTCHACI
jgi:hypothetical protein